MKPTSLTYTLHEIYLTNHPKKIQTTKGQPRRIQTMEIYSINTLPTEAQTMEIYSIKSLPTEAHTISANLKKIHPSLEDISSPVYLPQSSRSPLSRRRPWEPFRKTVPAKRDQQYIAKLLRNMSAGGKLAEFNVAFPFLELIVGNGKLIMDNFAAILADFASIDCATTADLKQQYAEFLFRCRKWNIRTGEVRWGMLYEDEPAIISSDEEDEVAILSSDEEDGPTNISSDDEDEPANISIDDEDEPAIIPSYEENEPETAGRGDREQGEIPGEHMEWEDLGSLGRASLDTHGSYNGSDDSKWTCVDGGWEQGRMREERMEWEEPDNLSIRSASTDGGYDSEGSDDSDYARDLELLH
jgi:hypothetical protein